MSESDEKMQREVSAVFEKLKGVELEASPYLETRVLAQWRERGQGMKRFLFWRNAAVASGFLCVAMAFAFLFQMKRGSDFTAFVDRPFVVRVSVSDLKEAKIARAEIVLPEGVFFDIEDYPELRAQRTLSLKWSPDSRKELVPFVLNSTQGGARTVTVRFYDEQNILVGEKRITVQLQEVS